MLKKATAQQRPRRPPPPNRRALRALHKSLAAAHEQGLRERLKAAINRLTDAR